MLRPILTVRRWLKSEDGVTTVEWLGMATIAVLVVAVLLPQVRTGSRDLWRTIVGELNGLFG